MNERVKDAFKEAYYRILPLESARLLWERVLSPAERRELGDDGDAAYRKLGTIGMWMHLRGVSRERATLDVARAIDLLSDVNYRWLLHEVCETEVADSESRPRWDRNQGKLFFGRDVIRTVRRLQQPSNIETILAAFEAAGWVHSIANPLTLGAEQLAQALRSLNAKLQRIRFHACHGSKSISWDLKSQ